MDNFRTTTKLDNNTYIEDRGYAHIVSRGNADFEIVDAKFGNMLHIGQTAQRSQDGNGWDVIDGFPMLDYLKQEKLKEINEKCDEEMSKLTLTYPDTERLTFDQQKEEAIAFQRDESAPCTMLRSLAENRGITMSDLCGRVLTKAAIFSHTTGVLMGQRQKMEDALDACTTPAEVAAIHVSYSL